MAVTVTTAATTKQLTTVARVKEDLGITAPTFNTLISRKIDQASAMIVRACRQELARQVYSETIKGRGGNILTLDRTPIVSVASVSYKGVALPAASYNIEDAEAGFLFNGNGWNDSAYRSFGLSGAAEDASRKAEYTVVYTAGFWLPGMTGTVVAPTLPEEIEYETCELAKMLYLSKDRDQSIQSESVVNVGSVTYRSAEAGVSSGTIPASIIGAIAPWIRTSV